MAAESESEITPRKEEETVEKRLPIYVRPGIVSVPLLQQRLFCDPSPVFTGRENGSITPSSTAVIMKGAQESNMKTVCSSKVVLIKLFTSAGEYQWKSYTIYNKPF